MLLVFLFSSGLTLQNIHDQKQLVEGIIPNFSPNVNLDADMKDWFMQRKSLRRILLQMTKDCKLIQVANWVVSGTELMQMQGKIGKQ